MLRKASTFALTTWILSLAPATMTAESAPLQGKPMAIHKIKKTEAKAANGCCQNSDNCSGNLICYLPDEGVAACSNTAPNYCAPPKKSDTAKKSGTAKKGGTAVQVDSKKK